MYPLRRLAPAGPVRLQARSVVPEVKRRSATGVPRGQAEACIAHGGVLPEERRPRGERQRLPAPSGALRSPTRRQPRFNPPVPVSAANRPGPESGLHFAEPHTTWFGGAFGTQSDDDVEGGAARDMDQCLGVVRKMKVKGEGDVSPGGHQGTPPSREITLAESAGTTRVRPLNPTSMTKPGSVDLANITCAVPRARSSAAAGPAGPRP